MSDDSCLTATCEKNRPQPTVDPTTDGGVTVSDILEALASQRRRYALYYLQDEEYSELEELAEYVAAKEYETSLSELHDQAFKDVRIDLYHTQLPKLEDAGIIAFDSRNKAVRYHEPPDAIEQFLDYCAMLETPD